MTCAAADGISTRYFILKVLSLSCLFDGIKRLQPLKGRMLQIAPIFDNMCHVIVNTFLSVLSSIDFFVGLLNGIKSHDLVRHLLLDENSSSRRGLVIRLRERKNSRIPAVRSERIFLS